jgi:hypothetical protein
MNCEHHKQKPHSFNDLISTAYSPKTRGEGPVNNSNRPINKRVFHSPKLNYSQPEVLGITACEQVSRTHLMVFEENQAVETAEGRG